jgi:hypothetical protein
VDALPIVLAAVASAVPGAFAIVVVLVRRKIAIPAGLVAVLLGLLILWDSRPPAIADGPSPSPIGGLSAAGNLLERYYGWFFMTGVMVAIIVRGVTEVARWRVAAVKRREADLPRARAAAP